ncbi:MAG: M20/M25/M40 family metallo-hydrolase [Chitinivibrionales bacterium]|nr:M20/M25/M40 family metallo-hydrolase [Chitinivibrionales bacterium]
MSTIKVVSCMIIAFSTLFAQVRDYGSTVSRLTSAVTVNGVISHMAMLEKIAFLHDTNRASGTKGHEYSALYIATKLWLAGYKIQIQKFNFYTFAETADPVFERVAPDPIVYKPNSPQGMYTFSFSGSGSINGIVQPIDIMIPPGKDPNTSTSGCEEEDFLTFNKGNIALIQRGTCTFRQKVLNAQNAGAVAVIIFNEGQENRTEAMKSSLSKPDITIPVLFTSYEIGKELYELSQTQEVKVHVAVTGRLVPHKTYNVIAETRSGKIDSIAMIGAHLDGASQGPGIGDNGSGSAAILEAALKLAEMKITVKNKVRFAFWSGEEQGLLGSTYYVEQLTQEQRKQIRCYLNFDMIASPNYVRFVYDGDGSTFNKPGPEGSGFYEELLKNYFDIMNIANEPVDMNGRSDYQPFADAGIPYGGLFTGADNIKTEAQAAIYGGVAGQMCDPNYHKRQDDLSNCNFDVLKDMLDALTYAVIVCAFDDLPQPLEYGMRAACGGSEAEYQGNNLIR